MKLFPSFVRSRRSLLLPCALLVCVSSGLVRDARAVQSGSNPIGSIISYQGQLTDTTGKPLADGSQAITFTIYEDGTAVSTSTLNVMTIGGVFNTFFRVGSLSFDPAKSYDLGISVSGTAEVRHPISAVPVALNAKSATNFSGALAGDVSGTQGATKVEKIQGQAVSTTAPSDGQVLRFNATSGKYEPAADGPVAHDNTISGTGLNDSPLSVAQNYVTLSGDQTVVGSKTFSSAVDSPTGYNINGAPMLQGTDNSVFVGPSTGIGAYGTFLGWRAGQANTLGQSNVMIGAQAGQNNTTGGSNTFVGPLAGLGNITGNDNTFVGNRAGETNTAGENNVFLGFSAGLYNTTGRNNIAIGSNAGLFNMTGRNNIYLGNMGVDGEGGTDEVGTMRFGGNQTRTFIAGIRDVPVAGGAAVYIDANGQLGTATASSRRFKQDIRSLGHGSDWLLKLRPVSFRYTAHYLHASLPSPMQYGLVAEEVAQVAPQMVHRDGEGRPDGVNYQDMPIFLLNLVQQQQKTIEQQNKAIEQLQSNGKELQKRLDRVEARENHNKK